MHEEEKKAFEALKAQISEFKNEVKDKASQEGLEKLGTQIGELQKSLNEWSEKKIDQSITEINKELSTFRDQVVALREEQAKQKEEGASKKKGGFVSTKEVENFVKELFKNEDSISNAKLQMKGAETFSASTFFAEGSEVSAFTGRMVDPTLYQRTRKRNLILDHFNILTINVPKLLYLEKLEIGDGTPIAGDPGGAAWILGGEAKPKRSFRVTTGEAEAKKVAIFGTVEDKLLRDVASLENWILQDFRDELLEAYNDGLLNNNIDVNPKAPMGLKSNAVLFAPTPAFETNIPDANYIDAIVAVASAFRNNKEQLQKVFISDDVWYAIHILKDNDKRYQNNEKVYTNAMGNLVIAGIEVIPADNEDIPDTHILAVGANPGFRIHNYGGMVLESGLNGEDFREDKTSYRGYQEVLTYLPSNRENSVMYDTFANILTAINKPA